MSNWVSYYKNEGEEEEEEEQEGAENVGKIHFWGMHMLLICWIEMLH